MKPPSVTPIRGAGTVPVAATDALPNAERSLQWVDEVAALLPEESRLGWYQNVRPWLRMLPPDDEVAHLAYSMGYLALLTRNTPELIAAERVQLTGLFQRLTDEMTGAVKTNADYHQKLNDSLSKLPAEITRGLGPAALASGIVNGVREHFLQCGIPEAGRLLKEQGDRLRQLAANQDHALSELRQQLNDSRNRARDALDNVTSGADAAKKSIDLWNREMRQVLWLHLGLALLTGFLLGALLYWWVLAPQEVGPPQRASGTQQSQPSAVVSGRSTKHAPR